MSLRGQSSKRYEYRVTWQRMGMKRVRAIRQTEAGAQAKVKALLWAEAQKKDGHYEDYGSAGSAYYDDPYANMPDLIGPPTIEVREVGEWEESATVFPQGASPDPAADSALVSQKGER